MFRNFIGVALLLAASGCGGSHGAHPVAGTVRWSDEGLAGHLVEFAHPTDPSVRGFGTIGADGRFVLERLADGKTVPGLPTGTYQARVVLNDEGDGQIKKPKVPARYLNFKTSGWSVQVPAPGDVTLTVTK